MPDYKIPNVDGSEIHLPSLLGSLELTMQPTFARFQFNYIFLPEGKFSNR
jgi:hypothetical protein